MSYFKAQQLCDAIALVAEREIALAQRGSETYTSVALATYIVAPAWDQATIDRVRVVEVDAARTARCAAWHVARAQAWAAAALAGLARCARVWGAPIAAPRFDPAAPRMAPIRALRPLARLVLRGGMWVRSVVRAGHALWASRWRSAGSRGHRLPSRVQRWRGSSGLAPRLARPALLPTAAHKVCAALTIHRAVSERRALSPRVVLRRQG